MANRYFVSGGVDNNWSTSGNWSTSSGGAGGETVPTSSDDVFLDANSPNCTIDAAASCLSLTCTGYTNTLTHNAGVNLNIYGSMTFVSGMTYTYNNLVTSAIRFYGDGDITSGGQSLPYLYFYGSSKTYYLIDNCDIDGRVYIDYGGHLHTDGSADNSGLSHNMFFLQNGNNNPDQTLTLGNSTITLTRSNSYAIQLNNNTTINCGTSTIIMSGSGTVTFASPPEGATWYNITRTGTASKTDALSIEQDFTVTGTLTLTGNSVSNRLLVYSSTFGTARTITNTGATMTWSNVDFRDIALSDAYDASGISGGSGDCGGNSNITFTTADDWYWHVDGGNFSDYTKWYTATNGGGSQATYPPLPQDTAHFDANSFDNTGQTITADMPRMGSVDWTGATNSPTWSDGGSTADLYGSITLISGMTFSWTAYKYFKVRGAHTLTMAGNSFSNRVYNQNIGGTLTLQDALSSSNIVYHSHGTWDANDYNVTTKNFNTNASTTRTLNMGSGTWTITDDSGDAWDAGNTTNLTLNEETSTIVLSDTGASQKNFVGGGETYYNITITGGGAGEVVIEGSNTFNTFTINKPKTVKFTDGTTTTVASLVADGDAADGITLTGTSTGGWTISDSTGTNAVSYCTISYSTAQGGATWDATDNCTDDGNNSGWTFATAWAQANSTTVSVTTTLSEKNAMHAESQSIATTDTLVKNFSHAISQAITTLTTEVKNTTKVIPQSVTVTDTISMLPQIVLSDSITVTTTVAKVFFKALSESVTVTDTDIKNIFKNISESISVTDTITTPSVAAFIKERYITAMRGTPPHLRKKMQVWISGLTIADIESMERDFRDMMKDFE